MPRRSINFWSAQGWFRSRMPASAWWLTGVAAILMVVTVVNAAGDPGGDGGILNAFLFPRACPPRGLC